MPAIIERLPQQLSFNDVEAIARHVEGCDSLTIDLYRFRRARLFGEGALLGLIMLARTKGKEVHVHLGGELPSFTPGTPNRYWKIFTESAAGFVMGQLAHVILDSSDRDVTATIRRQQSQSLKAEHGYIGSGKEVAAAIMDRYGAPSSADVIRESNVTTIQHLLAYTMAARLGVVGQPTGAFSNVATFASELLENTRDHATTDLDNVPIEGARFLNIRRINTTQEDVTELAPPEDEAGGYAVALNSLLSCSTHAEHLVEMTVSDSGIGIAARMEKTDSIYDAPIDKERRVLVRAFEKGGSSKPTSVTGRGLGLQKALEATTRLGGLFVVRTGRSRLYYFSKAGDGGGEGTIQGIDDPVLPYLPGTSISLLFPWKVRSKQMNLFGESDASNCR